MKLSRQHSIFISKTKKEEIIFKLSETEPPSKVVLLESGKGSNWCINNAISTVNSEDSNIFHNSDGNPFDAECKKDN